MRQKRDLLSQILEVLCVLHGRNNVCIHLHLCNIFLEYFRQNIDRLKKSQLVHGCFHFYLYVYEVSIGSTKQSNQVSFLQNLGCSFTTEYLQKYTEEKKTKCLNFCLLHVF